MITGVKGRSPSKVATPLTSARHGASEALTGYREPEADGVLRAVTRSTGSDYPDLRDCAGKTAASTTRRWYGSRRRRWRLGFGFRCGFLGLLAHGDHPRAVGARVRSGPDLHVAERRVSGGKRRDAAR